MYKKRTNILVKGLHQEVDDLEHGSEIRSSAIIIKLQDEPKDGNR